MRAGKLDKIITIGRVTNTVDDFGTPQEGWATVATVRAQRVKLTTEEFLSWQASIDEYGLAGLRTTRIQQYRH